MRRDGGVNACVPRLVPPPPSETTRESRAHVALLVSYNEKPSEQWVKHRGCLEQGGWEVDRVSTDTTREMKHLFYASLAAFPPSAAAPVPAPRVSWAVPPARSAAAGNVVGLRLPRAAETVEEEDRLRATLDDSGESDGPQLLSCRKVPCSFNARRSCELERFEALLPWSVFGCEASEELTDSTRGVTFDRTLARRLKQGLRQLRKGKHWQNFCERSMSQGDPPSFFMNRLAATVERPGWCLISLSVQRSLPQMIPRLLGALVLWCRGFAPTNFLEEAVAEHSRVSVPSAPESCFYLLAPHMARFEHKNQVNLTFGFPEVQLLVECKRMFRAVLGEVHGRELELPITTRLSAHLQTFRDRIISQEAATGELQRWSDRLAKRRGDFCNAWVVEVSWGFNGVLQERRLDERNGHTAEEDLQRRERVTMLRQRATLDLWREALLFHKAALWQEVRPRLVMDITGQSMLQMAFRALARRSVHRRKARRAQEGAACCCNAVQAKLSESRLIRSFDHWAKAFEMESSSFFASRILGRSKLKRILLRWKQHTNFRAGFATQVVKTLQQLELQRLHRTFDAWKQRPHLRHLAAGMWLLRRKSWISAVFVAWKDEAVKAAARRRHLRYFHRQVKFNKASRAGKVQRKHSHGRFVRKVFKAYAAWVKRARGIQARAKHLGTELCLARKAQRLGAWAAHCRAFHVSAKRATQVFNAWLTQARREKTLSWASRSLASDQLRRAGQEGLRKLRSWCIFRRTLRAMMAGRRQTLLSSVLYCWVAALLPARHAARAPGETSGIRGTWVLFTRKNGLSFFQRGQRGNAICAMEPPAERAGRERTGSWITENLSLGRALGYPAYTFRRLLLLVSCLLGVVQYGLVSTNGVTVKDFNEYYQLTTEQGDFLYGCMNFGACALSFVPGLIYDRLGCIAAMILGTVLADCGVLLQIVWTPDWPDFVSTMGGLAFCYTCFGFASTFFNVIGSFAPLSAFPVEYVGKVSACIQVCMSLGITIQTQAYYFLKKLGGDPIMHYLEYALVSFNLVGILMCTVFYFSSRLLKKSEEAEDQGMEPEMSLTKCLCSVDFAYMFLLFCSAIGFSFSFLNCMDPLSAEVGVSGTELGSVFGLVNALGRLLVCLPLDYTRNYRWGGIYVYIFASLLIYTVSMLILAIPASPTATMMRTANVFASLGYGGLLGIVPPALRITFGTQHLGMIYGLLYVGVAIFEPLWSLLFQKTDGCVGVQCYHLYTRSSACALLITLLATWAVLRSQQMRGSREALLQCDGNLPQSGAP
eukprot:s1076_g9.t1